LRPNHRIIGAFYAPRRIVNKNYALLRSELKRGLEYEQSGFQGPKAENR
jgi:hypothetical protein